MEGGGAPIYLSDKGRIPRLPHVGGRRYRPKFTILLGRNSRNSRYRPNQYPLDTPRNNAPTVGHEKGAQRKGPLSGHARPNSQNLNRYQMGGRLGPPPRLDGRTPGRAARPKTIALDKNVPNLVGLDLVVLAHVP